jgi:hypothetical protein
MESASPQKPKGVSRSTQTTTITINPSRPATAVLEEGKIDLPQSRLPVPKHAVPQNTPVLLRRGTALVHPAKPTTTVCLVLRRALVLSLLDKSQRPHLATHHNGASTSGTSLTVTTGSDAAGRRSRVTDVARFFLRVRGRVGGSAQTVDIGC